MRTTATPETLRRWATIDEGAKHVGVHPKTLRRHIAAGIVPAHRLGRSVRVDLAELDAAFQRVPSA